MVVDNKIQIVEIFKSLNGEGWASGLPTVFIRTMGCNLCCQYGTDMGNKELSGFCDTPESINETLFKKMYPNKNPLFMSAEEIFNHVEALEKNFKYKSICLTGGEPLLECNKQFMIAKLLPMFINAHYDVSIETNGSIDYSDYHKYLGSAKTFTDGHREGLTIIADYKLPSSKMTPKMLAENLKTYTETDLIKMVVSDNEEDWKELEKVISSETKAQFYISPMYGRVDTEKLWHFAENHADKNVRVQVQLHKYMFHNPNEKGV